jgi:hypothetical protein
MSTACDSHSSAAFRAYAIARRFVPAVGIINSGGISPALVYQDAVARLCSGIGLAENVRRHGDP